MIERTPVESSNIKSIGYDKDGKTLAVEFKNGGIYHYHDFPKTAHTELLGAKSIGGHLNKIKNQYKYIKQDDK